jgi:hypothetical protein
MQRMNRIHVIATTCFVLSIMTFALAFLIGMNRGFDAFTEIGWHNSPLSSFLQFMLYSTFVFTLATGLVLRAIEKDFAEDMIYLEKEIQRTKQGDWHKR